MPKLNIFLQKQGMDQGGWHKKPNPKNPEKKLEKNTSKVFFLLDIFYLHYSLLKRYIFGTPIEKNIWVSNNNFLWIS